MGVINKKLLSYKNEQDIDFIDYSSQIEEFYNQYNIKLSVKKHIQSYSITRFFASIESKTKLSAIENLVEDLSLSLNIKNIKISIDYESGLLAFEIPNRKRKTLYFSEILQDNVENEGLQIPIGKDLNNNTYTIDLCKTPHLLVAGTTGSGKSVFLNTVLLNLINNYDDEYLNLFLIDPKRVELSIYKNIRQVDVGGIARTLEGSKRMLLDILSKINERYELLEKSNTRSIASYNKKSSDKLPYIVIVIDELADILMQDRKSNRKKIKENFENSLESIICRIAQIGRACGVHLIVATQRPSSDVIKGLIKANIPSRVAFSVSNGVDSRVILDTRGAEKLTGQGDMLFKMVGDEELHRIQGAFVSDEEVENVVEKLEKLNVLHFDSKEKQEQLKKLHDALLLKQHVEECVQQIEKNTEEVKNISNYTELNPKQPSPKQEFKNFAFNSAQYGCSIPAMIIWFILFVIIGLACL